MLQGPEDLSFAEVQSAVVEIERLSGDRCQVRPGVAASLPKGSPLTLFITASAGGEQPVSKGAAGIKTAAAEPTPVSVPVGEPLPAVQPEAVSERPPLPPKQRLPRQNPPVKQTQGTLELDTYQRGRFDKSEPTIVAGEDLDIPTFLRKGIKLAQPRRS
jgi:hypothetical protein